MAIVELDEGPWLYARIVGEDGGSATIGSRVAIGFERPEAGLAIPGFRII